MSAKSELERMSSLWNESQRRRGQAVEIQVSAWRDPRGGMFTAAALTRIWGSDVRLGSILASYPREKEEDAWEDLLRQYSLGRHFRSTEIWIEFDDPRTLFPPCGSADELEIRLTACGRLP